MLVQPTYVNVTASTSDVLVGESFTITASVDGTPQEYIIYKNGVEIARQDEAVFSVVAEAGKASYQIGVVCNGIEIKSSAVEIISKQDLSGKDLRGQTEPTGELIFKNTIWVDGEIKGFSMESSANSFTIAKNETISAKISANATISGGAVLTLSNGGKLESINNANITVNNSSKIAVNTNATLDASELIVSGAEKEINVSSNGALNLTKLTHNSGIVEFVGGVSTIDSIVSAITTLGDSNSYKHYLDIKSGATINLGTIAESVSNIKGLRLGGTLNIENGVAKFGGKEGFNMRGGILNIKPKAIVQATDEKAGGWIFTIHEGVNKIKVLGTGENAGQFSTYNSTHSSENLRIGDYTSSIDETTSLEISSESEKALRVSSITFLRRSKLVLKTKNVIANGSSSTGIALGSNTNHRA